MNESEYIKFSQELLTLTNKYGHSLKAQGIAQVMIAGAIGGISKVLGNRDLGIAYIKGIVSGLEEQLIKRESKDGS